MFNAAVKLEKPVRDICRSFDSVSFCLSKGLGAPVGSLLCGSDALIAKARRWRKSLGGGMRQAGIIAAAGLYALEHNVERLAQDHANAASLAEQLGEIDEITVDTDIETNMVFADLNELDTRGSHFYLAMYWAQALAEQTTNQELQSEFKVLAAKLNKDEQQIVDELNAAQGSPQDLGGYYSPTRELVEKAMRPSETFNAAINSL